MSQQDNLISNVRRFTELAGCTTDEFNIKQLSLYIGLQLEELAEKIGAILAQSDGFYQAYRLIHLRDVLNDVSYEFKSNSFSEELSQANRQDLLDADVDLAWVTIGSMFSQGANVEGAISEVTRANLDKFPNGVTTRDANGKVVKPEGWQGPDLSAFVKANYEQPIDSTGGHLD